MQRFLMIFQKNLYKYGVLFESLDEKNEFVTFFKWKINVWSRQQNLRVMIEN